MYGYTLYRASVGGTDLLQCFLEKTTKRLTSRRSQRPLALSVPLSRSTSRVGGGSAFFVRHLPRMARRHDFGDCEHCKKQFGYYLIHTGFNESSYAYCDSCGFTALLDGWKVPKSIQMVRHQNIAPEIETHLAPCQCGGAFRAGASPRCPHCRQPLSADRAADFIERQAEGTKKGWRWQRSWTSLYCIIIEDKVVHDIWK
jgi:hypothetical protein